jgi:leucyl aminopeptidase (aminopeptidase T)
LLKSSLNHVLRACLFDGGMETTATTGRRPRRSAMETFLIVYCQLMRPTQKTAMNASPALPRALFSSLYRVARKDVPSLSSATYWNSLTTAQLTSKTKLRSETPNFRIKTPRRNPTSTP